MPPSRIADGYATWAVLIVPYMDKNKPKDEDHPLIQWDISKPYAAQPAAMREAWLIPMHCPSYPRPGRLSTQGDLDAAGQLLPGSIGDYACVSGDGREVCLWTGPEANGAMIVGQVDEPKDSCRSK